MDEKDKELLRILETDARTSTTCLAEMLGMSRSTVQNRIDRMMHRGIINRFTIKLGDEVEGVFIDAIVMIKLSTRDSRPTIARLKEMEMITRLSSLNGEFDLVIDVRVSSLPFLDETLLQIRSLDTVAETNCSVRLADF